MFCVVGSHHSYTSCPFLEIVLFALRVKNNASSSLLYFHLEFFFGRDLMHETGVELKSFT